MNSKSGLKKKLVEHKIKNELLNESPSKKNAYTCKTNQAEWVGFMFNKKKISPFLILHLFYYGLLEKINFNFFHSKWFYKKKR